MRARRLTVALFLLGPRSSVGSPINRLPINPQIRHPTGFVNYTTPSRTQVSVINSVVVTLAVPSIPTAESTPLDETQVTVCVELVDYSPSGVPSLALCSSQPQGQPQGPAITTSTLQAQSSTTPLSYPAVFPISDIPIFSTTSEPETALEPILTSSILETRYMTSTFFKTITTTKPCPESSSSAVAPPPIVPITVTFPEPNPPEYPASTTVYPSESSMVSVPKVSPFPPMDLTSSAALSYTTPLEISPYTPIVSEPTIPANPALTTTSPIGPKITIIPIEATPSKFDDGPITIIPVDPPST